jgi:ubiquitin-activating enzyme E1
MTELNDSKPRPVKVINPYSFSIEDTTKYKPYLPGKGYFQQVKMPATFEFSPLSALSSKPNVSTIRRAFAYGYNVQRLLLTPATRYVT